jgi:hypothetical protein
VCFKQVRGIVQSTSRLGISFHRGHKYVCDNKNLFRLCYT